jgi:hypothetical protein
MPMLEATFARAVRWLQAAEHRRVILQIYLLAFTWRCVSLNAKRGMLVGPTLRMARVQARIVRWDLGRPRIVGFRHDTRVLIERSRSMLFCSHMRPDQRGVCGPEVEACSMIPLVPSADGLFDQHGVGALPATVVGPAPGALVGLSKRGSGTFEAARTPGAAE